MSNRVRALVVGAAAIAATVIPATSASAQVCGFWENASSSYYRHCANSRVVVKVDTHPGQGSPFEFCALPWSDTYLGPASKIANAYYAGRVC